MPKRRILTLSPCDGEDIMVDIDVAEYSLHIKSMLEQWNVAEEPIPIPNVSRSVLEKVFKWCQHHHHDPKEGGEALIDSWDEDFMEVEGEMVWEIMIAANYLGIPGLLDLSRKTIENAIKGKSPEEIRKAFNIPFDFIP